MSERLATALLLGVSCLLSLVAGELILRALGIYGERIGTIEHVRPVDDPVLDYRGTPNVSYMRDGHRYDKNQHGYRDYSYDYRKPAGTLRIVVIGDSVTHGYGVEMEDIYPKVLERLLNRDRGSSPRYEVLMLSLGALNAEQEVHLLVEEGLLYDPDIIVIGYVLNDAGGGTSLKAQLERRANQSVLLKVKRLARRSSLLFHGVRTLQQLKWSVMTMFGRTETASYVEQDQFTASHENPRSWTRVENSFARLRRVADDTQAFACVMIFPVLYDLDSYRWSQLHSKVAEAARRHGLDSLDLLPAFRSYPAHQLQVASGDHIHPNELGHRIAGEALLRFLRDRGWLTLEVREQAEQETARYLAAPPTDS